MNEIRAYLVSDSTSETLDRIFFLKSQFANFDYEKEFAFVKTEQQIDRIIKDCNKMNNSLIKHTIVETKLAKYLKSKEKYFLWHIRNLILSFSKLLNQKPKLVRNVLDEYYKRIEAIQFTMSHDDGKKLMILKIRISCLV